MCGPGYTLQGKECVKKPVCGGHAFPNRAGNKCLCERGYVMKRGVCVHRTQGKKHRRKEKKDGRTPNDVIRVLPGIVPSFGGHHGGGHHGGGRSKSGDGGAVGGRDRP